MSFAAISAGVALGGLALTAKGQSDAKKANKAALAEQSANWKAQQQENWRRYMLSRGVDTANGGRAVNTQLPMWAVVKRSDRTPTIVGT